MTTESQFGRVDCQKHEALLEDYLNAELSGAEGKAAIEHWQNCPSCRAQLEDAALSTRLLRAAEPAPDPGPGFARRVMASIRAAESERSALRANFWQPFVSFGWRFAATATLALIALVSYNARWSRHAQPNVVTVRPTEGMPMDILAPEPTTVAANADEALF